MTRAPSSATAKLCLLRERGFTLVETMVAVTILLVGILGVVAMADGASKATASSRARDTGINLARRVIEGSNSLAYQDVTSTGILPKLQAKPGLADTSIATGWQIQSRNVTYTVSITLCDIDDPKDGTGAHTASFCPGSGAGGTNDATPQDYKRVTASVSWGLAGTGGSVSQSTFVTPRGTADLPVITSLTSSVNSPVTDPTVTTVPFTATTSSVPAGVSWLKDGSVMGLASGSGNSWNFNWNINSLLDGDYVIGARPYDGAGSYGAPYYMTFSLNRYAPAAPTNFAAGYDSGDVSTEWLPNRERDVIGYTVYRQQTSPTAGAATKVNCGTVGSPVYVTTKTTCKDASPVPGAPTIDYVSASKGTSETSTLTVPKPTNLQTGDVMVAAISAAVNGNAVTPPAGWTVVPNADVASTGGSQGMRLAVYTRVVTASEPASWNWALGAVRSASGTISAWRGASTTTPVEASANYKTGGNAADDYTPALTTLGPNRQVILVHSHRSSTTGLTQTTPAGTTLRVGERGNSVIHSQFTKFQATAGSTGTMDVGGICGYLCETSVSTCGGTGGCGGQWVGAAVVLKPTSSPITVNYWVVAVDRDAAGANREGAASNVVNAYAVNTRPNPPSNPTLTVQADGSRKLDWATAGSDPDTGDSISFYRVYRDGAAYDRTSTGTDLTYTDPNRTGGSHTYYLVAVDSHLRESFATASASG
jgi:prepilin-type N-terminal cleavage/methylation domain-containing protein